MKMNTMEMCMQARADRSQAILTVPSGASHNDKALEPLLCVVEASAAHTPEPGRTVTGTCSLSPSLAEIMALLAVVEHGTTKRAAEAMFRSRHTVEWHLSSLRRKTKLSHVHQLVARAIVEGWIGPGDIHLPGRAAR
jgi:DNA-binding CsgD family transcriptional regulator